MEASKVGVWDKVQNRFVYRTSEERRAAAETRARNLQDQFVRLRYAYPGYAGSTRIKPGRKAVRYEVRVIGGAS